MGSKTIYLMVTGKQRDSMPMPLFQGDALLTYLPLVRPHSLKVSPLAIVPQTDDQAFNI
jgi:hypothetical protein